MYKVLSIDTVSEGFSGQPVKKRKRIKGPKSLADTKMPPPIDLGFLGQPQPISLNGHCSTEMNQKDAFFLECYPLLSGQSQASQRLLSELYSCINGMCPEPPFSLNEKDPLLEASFSEINRKISEYLLDNPDQNRGFSIRLELILKILFNKIKTSNGNWGLCIAQVLKILPEQVWSQSLSNYMFKNLYGIDSFYFNTAIIETMIEVMPLKLLRDERTRIKEYLQQKDNGSYQAPLIKMLDQKLTVLGYQELLAFLDTESTKALYDLYLSIQQRQTQFEEKLAKELDPRLKLILNTLFDKIKSVPDANCERCIAIVLKLLPKEFWSQTLTDYLFEQLNWTNVSGSNSDIIETMKEVMPLKLLRAEETRIKEYLQQKGNGSCQAPLIQKLAGRCVATVQDKSDSMSLYDQMKSKLALHEQVHLES